MVDLAGLVGLLVVAFAGGAFGASVGGLQAFSFAGVLIVVGEAVNIARETPPEPGVDLTALGATGITASLGLGPGFGPHVAFAAGCAAAAYAARQGYMDTGFDFFEAKNITYALGTRPDVLVVGGIFGAIGVLITHLSVAGSLPWDPIAFSIVVSAFLHRIAFGYPLIGEVRGGSILDMSPFERGERRTTAREAARADGGIEPEEEVGDARLAVEPWLPHQYKWANVTVLGAVVGIFSAFVTYRTGSPFLAFGITAATLIFLCLGMEKFPITHHMALPASIAVIGIAGGAMSPEAIAQETPLLLALLVGGVFGVICAIAGELTQRVFYAHADTHLDPPAAAIVVGTLLVAVLDIVGLLSQGVIPTLGL